MVRIVAGRLSSERVARWELNCNASTVNDNVRAPGVLLMRLPCVPKRDYIRGTLHPARLQQEPGGAAVRQQTLMVIQSGIT